MRDDFTIQLEQVFKGPMDLLLHLVHEQEVEIHEVEIHRVITGYFEYLGQLVGQAATSRAARSSRSSQARWNTSVVAKVSSFG